MISICRVGHTIQGKPILEDINLELPRGGVTALIGPNGAGKSTLLSLAARLQALKTGTIMVDDLQIGACSDATLARVLAIMRQSAQVSARLRVGEAVMMERYPWHQGRPGKSDSEIVAETLALFSFDPLADQFLDEISGGQRQRALVAMAYARETDYLLLDEPLNNLDIAASRHLMRLLRQMADAGKKSIVIVLHDINFAAAFADRIVIMRQGRIVADGTPSAVITPALLTNVFETDAQVHLLNNRPVVLV